MLRKTEGRRRREQQKMKWLDGMTDFKRHEPGQTPGDGEDREAWCAAVPEVVKHQP